jgi:hypothetical protein
LGSQLSSPSLLQQIKRSGGCLRENDAHRQEETAFGGEPEAWLAVLVGDQKGSPAQRPGDERKNELLWQKPFNSTSLKDTKITKGG